MGKVLWVDLSSGVISEENIPDEVYESYLSGMGLAAHLLYERIPAGADPLGPENILGFVSGLLTGTGSLFSGRWMVVGKSPLTGGWGDANCGGTFSPAIKRCGYDGIFFKGMSEKPVYLHVSNGKAELIDASDYWGEDAVRAEEMLLEKHGKRSKVALIGPAAEKLSLISGVCNEKGRMAARSGLGAVMGSKKLKAVVLDGAKKIPCNDKAEMKRLSQKANRWVQFQPPFIPGWATGLVGYLIGALPVTVSFDGMLYKLLLRRWGTGGMNQISVGMGDSPIKNWKGTNADFNLKKQRSVDPDLFTDCEVVKYHCYSCPLGCGGICKTNGKYSETHKPEYETVLALGGLCMNEDTDSIFFLNEFLNRAGMDSISAGGTIAFAIECFEKGIITEKDTGGITLKWGDKESIIAIADLMVKREGIGDLLADGSKIAAQKLGNGSIEFAIQAGGQEPAMHDGRADAGFNLHYCVEPTPGRHTLGSHLYYELWHLWKKVDGVPKLSMFYHKDHKFEANEKNARIGAANSKFINVVNGAGLCMFGTQIGVERIPVFEWLNAATGWKKTPNQYMDIGERIQTLKQSFNIKHGIEPKDNIISSRALGRPPLPDGANKGRTADIEKMISDYWELFGWNKNSGKPEPETMSKLGIR